MKSHNMQALQCGDPANGNYLGSDLTQVYYNVYNQTLTMKYDIKLNNSEQDNS